MVWLQGDSVQSRNQICKAIHKHPECSSLWKLLSKNLQNVTVGGAKVAPVCCRIASHAKHDQQVGVFLLSKYVFLVTAVIPY